MKNKYVKINFHEIIYVEGCRNYVKLVTETKSHLVLFSIKGIEKFLPSYLFKRIHKSFIVSLEAITAFESNRVFLKDKELPVGACYNNVLHESVAIVRDGEIRTPAVTMHAYNWPAAQYRN